MPERDDAVVPVASPGKTLWFGNESSPAVVVVHDWYGRLPGLRDYCAALAAHGFRVAAPDLYGGVCTTDTEAAERLMSGLALEPALAAIDECATAAAAPRVGVIGFSIGGRLALAHAQTGAADAVVAYYATLGPDAAAVLPCPVMLHFAERDEWEDGEDPEEFVARLQDHGTPVARLDYAGTAHAFANADISEVYDASASARAFASTAAFLQRQLGG